MQQDWLARRTLASGISIQPLSLTLLRLNILNSLVCSCLSVCFEAGFHKSQPGLRVCPPASASQGLGLQPDADASSQGSPEAVFSWQ